MGFSAAKTYDLEVWIQVKNPIERYHHALTVLIFKRRAKMRFKEDGISKFTHTLNGSALAAGRALIAIIENNFDQKSKITIPEFFKIIQSFHISVYHNL